MSDRSSIQNLHPLRRMRPLVSMFALAFVLGAMPASTLAQIQLDGNAKKSVDPAGVGGTDWDEVLCPSSEIACAGLTAGGGAIAKTTLVDDHPEPTSGFSQFSTGGSKDEQDITSWRHRGGAPPNKDDLSHAFAAAFSKDVGGGLSHTILAFGMDRFDTSGDAQLGFWFLGDNAQPGANGNFVRGNTTVPARHQNGDLLVLVNFSNGGTVPTIQVFQWQNGGVVPKGTGQAVLCVNGGIPGGKDFCGITNASAVAAPWPYSISSGDSTSFPAGSFFEGAINLTTAGLESCFTGFLTESRSSTSITATLKDFAIPGGGFNLCSVSVTKSCVDGRLTTAQDEMKFTIKGEVKNTGAATIYDVTLSDNPAVDLVNGEQHFDAIDCTSLQNVGAFPITSLASGAKICYQATITSVLRSQNFQDTVSVSANSEADGSGTTLSNTAQATCDPPDVVGGLTVTKNCTTSLIDNGATLAVRVNVTGKICNAGGAGGSNLTNITLADDVFTIPGGTLPKTTLALDDPNTPGPDTLGECMNYSFTYLPSTISPGTATPANICFQDTVKANAKDIFGVAVPQMSATANCSLCPGATCPAPATP